MSMETQCTIVKPLLQPFTGNNMSGGLSLWCQQQGFMGYLHTNSCTRRGCRITARARWEQLLQQFLHVMQYSTPT